MKCYFITGVSSGIGAALVSELLSSTEDILIRGCSRRVPEIKDSRYKHYACDLTKEIDRNALAAAFFKDIPAEATSLVLINNAGTLGAIGSVGHIPQHTYDTLFSTNLIAPTLLCGVFIANFQTLSVKKVIINISSGAANKDYAGWAAYCASKAALDRFTSVVAAEQELQSFPVHVNSFAPGVIDTPMQEEIRSSTQAAFPSLNRFLDLHKNGDLVSPSVIAHKIIHIIADLSNFESK